MQKYFAILKSCFIFVTHNKAIISQQTLYYETGTRNSRNNYLFRM